MRTYNKEFKEEAVKLSDEVGVHQAALQLGIPYYMLADWRGKRKEHSKKGRVGSGHTYAKAGMSQREIELKRENTELRKANEIFKDALGFFTKDRKR